MVSLNDLREFQDQLDIAFGKRLSVAINDGKDVKVESKKVRKYEVEDNA